MREDVALHADNFDDAVYRNFAGWCKRPVVAIVVHGKVIIHMELMQSNIHTDLLSRGCHGVSPWPLLRNRNTSEISTVN